MKIFLSGVIFSVTAITSITASAGVAGWILSTSQYDMQNQTQTQTKELPADVEVTENESTKENAIKTATQPIATASSKPIKQIRNDTDSTPVDDVAAQHLDATSKFLNSPDITSLKTDNYMAVVLLNSALVQAGLETKLKTNNQTTKGLFNNAVGCINSKKSEQLNSVAKKLISDHSKIADINNLINSSAAIGSNFTAKCL